MPVILSRRTGSEPGPARRRINTCPDPEIAVRIVGGVVQDVRSEHPDDY
jgi:hypothetical protein